MPRRPKPPVPVAELQARADMLLELIALQSAHLEGVRNELEAELATIRASYEFRIADRVAAIEGMEKELTALMRGGKRAVFDGVDRVDLPHGSLVYLVADVVVKAKGMLKRLKALGKVDAIKVVESVKWEVIEGWTDEQLAEAGTRREPRESYSYELRTTVA